MMTTVHIYWEWLTFQSNGFGSLSAEDYYLVMPMEIFPSKEKACVLDEVAKTKSVVLLEMPTMVE